VRTQAFAVENTRIQFSPQLFVTFSDAVIGFSAAKRSP